MASQTNLPEISRYITTHDPHTGLSIFSPFHAATVPKTTLPNGSAFQLDYTTSSTPVTYTADADISAYNAHLASHPPLPPAHTTPNGTVLRHTEMPPSGATPMHRTLTLDYAVVLDGEVELVLDGGEVRVLRRGDTVIQRGTMHAWRNRSRTEWVRMLCVLMPVEEGWMVKGEVMRQEFRGSLPQAQQTQQTQQTQQVQTLVE